MLLKDGKAAKLQSGKVSSYEYPLEKLIQQFVEADFSLIHRF